MMIIHHVKVLALHLAGEDEPSGVHLENLVLADLLAWRDARLEPAELCYWRTAIGEEVDFVIESGGRLLPVRAVHGGREDPVVREEGSWR
jgi:predicted AAA+ superfamily ATPase